MFIAELSYKKPIAEIDLYLEAHREYLKKYYDKGVFVFSGPQLPRTGGIIIARAKDLATIKAISEEDPFTIHGVAEYRFTEFCSRGVAPGLEAYLEVFNP